MRLMRMVELIGLNWETELTEEQVKEATNATIVRILQHGTKTEKEFVRGRATLWLTEDGRVRCVTNEMADGGFARICADLHPHEDEQC